MILIANKEYHYVAMGMNVNEFRLMYAFRYFCIDPETGFISENNYSSHRFSLDEEGYLKHSKYYVYYDTRITFMLRLVVKESKDAPYYERVKCRVENFDFRSIQYHGTYAAVYYPSLSGDTSRVTRICMETGTDIIPTDKKEIFSPFCLFPIEKIDYENITISEFKKCVGYDEMKEYARHTPFIDAVKSFRNLWIGLKVFQENKFFHSDIKLNNIVFDDGIAKFIDFDLSFFVDNPQNSNDLFQENTLCSIFPTVANALAMTYYVRKTGKGNTTINDHSKKEREQYLSYYTDRFQYYGLDKILCNNIGSIHHYGQVYMDMISRYTTCEELEISFYYISIYQLAIAFFQLIKKYDTKKYRHSICNFLIFCLDFNRNGIVLIDDVIVCYDQMIRSIDSIIASERTVFELRSGDKVVHT